MAGLVSNNNGCLVLVSSPSGGGKTTIIKKIIETNTDKFKYSISLTTRKKRNGEVDGRDYWFVDEETFQEKINSDQLLEHENVHGNYYGTPKGPIVNWINNGNIVFMDVDVLGALSIRKKYPKDSLLIFLSPPDFKTLEDRLIGRSTETIEQIEIRMERVKKEMELAKEFDHIIINNEIDETVNSVLSVIQKRIS